MPGSPEQYGTGRAGNNPDTFHRCESFRIIITPCCGYLMTGPAFLTKRNRDFPCFVQIGCFQFMAAEILLKQRSRFCQITPLSVAFP